MNKVIWAAMMAATLVLAGVQSDAVLAQAPAKEPTKESAPATPPPATSHTDDAKAKAAEERKAKREERKAKRAEERRAKRAEERKTETEEARKERAAKRE